MKSKKKSKAIEYMIQYAKPYRMRFINLSIAMAAKAVINMLFIVMYGLIVDEIIYNRNVEAFLNFVLVTLILVIGYIAFQVLEAAAFWNTQLRFVLDLRIGIMKKFFKAKASDLCKIKSGDIQQTVNLDTPEFMNVITDNIFEVIGTFVVLILTFVLAFQLNLKIACMMLFVIPATVALTIFFGEFAKKRAQKVRVHKGNFNSWIYEMIQGIREIQLFAGEKNVTKQFESRYSMIVKASKKVLNINIFSNRAQQLIYLLLQLSFYALGSYLVCEDELSIGMLLTLISLTSLVNTNLTKLSEFYIMLRSRKVNLDKVSYYLSLPTEDTDEKEILEVTNGNIRFEQVSFQYDAKRPILKNVNLNIEPGEKIAIVGKSGVGKSTIVSLLIRLFDPNSGEIYIDDKKISECTHKSIRRNIGVVQQDVLMFEGSIYYNLTLGNRDYQMEDIWKACEHASIADYIRKLPDGMNTVLGKDGVSLSGGQKQRISIARIFLRNPKIIIFDEATSALDYESEKAIHNAWLELSHSKTSIVIAHRLASILGADKVAVVKDGEIIAVDTHEKLLQSCPHYLELFEAQYKGGGGVV